MKRFETWHQWPIFPFYEIDCWHQNTYNEECDFKNAGVYYNTMDLSSLIVNMYNGHTKVP